MDVGAGTGKLTRQLVDAGYDVVAIEPDAQMLAELRRVLPNVESHRAGAESLPLADESVDAVVAAQAFHWFDATAALAEFARVLRPGGTVGLVWNVFDSESEAYRRLAEYVRLPTEPQEASTLFLPSDRFVEPEARAFRHTHSLDASELALLASSWSAVATLSEPERAALISAIDSLSHELARDGTVALPYVAHAIRATRF